MNRGRTKAFLAITAISVGFVLAAVSGWTERDFKPVMHVSYKVGPDAQSVEHFWWQKDVGPGAVGETGVNMTGKVHDGYLELHIKRTHGVETHIVTLDKVYDLVFFETQ